MNEAEKEAAPLPVRSNAGLCQELERELRSMINPVYADAKGTESYERKRLLGEIDNLRGALRDALDAGDDGDWQSARRGIVAALGHNTGVTGLAPGKDEK